MALGLISLLPGDSVVRTVVCLKNDLNVKAALSPPESQLPLISDNLVVEYVGHRFAQMMKPAKA